MSGTKAMASLSVQEKAGSTGTWNYVCIIFKTTANGETTMLVTDPIKVTIKDASFTLEGIGSKEDPFKITSYGELKMVSDKVAGGEAFADNYFSLKTDLEIPAD